MIGHMADRTPKQKGDASEDWVYEKLLALGFRDVRMTPCGAPYDLEVDGYPVEVKYASQNRSGAWHFSIKHPRGRPFPVIAYVLCADGIVRAGEWTCIVHPGPVNTKAISLSRKTFKKSYLGMVENWKTLQPEPYDLVSRKLPPRMPVSNAVPIHGGYAVFAKLIEYAVWFSGLSVADFAHMCGRSERYINAVISGTILPDAALMYSLGMRIPVECVKRPEDYAGAARPPAPIERS